MRGVLTKEEEEGKAAATIPEEADREEENRNTPRPEGMNGNVFECFEEQTDRYQYAKTLEALEACARKTLKFAEDLAQLFTEEMEAPALDLPTALNDNASTVEEAFWAEELREFVKSKGTFKGNLDLIHVVVPGQCSESMKDDKPKLLGEYKEEMKRRNCV